MIRPYGIYLNSCWAVEILHKFVHNLHITDYQKREVLLQPVYFYKEMKEMGYICCIILPAQAKIRFWKGKLLRTKSESKKSAAYELVVRLIKGGILSKELKTQRQ